MQGDDSVIAPGNTSGSAPASLLALLSPHEIPSSLIPETPKTVVFEGNTTVLMGLKEWLREQLTYWFFRAIATSFAK